MVVRPLGGNLPSEQGLKLILAQREGPGFVAAQTRRESSIRTRIETLSSSLLFSCSDFTRRESSIRTRIETLEDPLGIQRHQLGGNLPSEQGLKRDRMDAGEIDAAALGGNLPSEQGLKPVRKRLFPDGPVPRRESSIRTRIETFSPATASAKPLPARRESSIRTRIETPVDGHGRRRGMVTRRESSIRTRIETSRSVYLCANSSLCSAGIFHQNKD